MMKRSFLLFLIITMKIEHLQLFTRVASTQNISRAGQELGLSAAVASTQLKKLEAQLGVRLIHRTTRQVSLTEEGQIFLPHAIEVLERLEHARAAVGVGSLSPQGKLRVTASASFGRLHILPLVSTFLTQYPDIALDLCLSDRLVDLVEGGFDVAIRDTALKDSAYVARKLCPVKRIVCASPAYLERYGQPMTPEELLDHQCVTLMGLETWSFRTPQGLKHVAVQGRFRTDNGEAARDACLQGVGLTLSSTWACVEALQTGRLVEVLSDFPLAVETALWAVYPSARLMPPKVRAFVDFLRQAYAHQPLY